MVFTPNDVDLKAIDTIRVLAADVVAKSKSGHPGAPMGLAPRLLIYCGVASSLAIPRIASG